MQKLEVKIPYLGSLPDKDKFYEVIGVDYEQAWIRVWTDEKHTKIAGGEFNPAYCELRIAKDGLFD